MAGDVGSLTDRPISTSTNHSIDESSDQTISAPPRTKHARARSFSQPDPFDPNPQIIGRCREASKTTGVPTETILASVQQSIAQSSAGAVIPWDELQPLVESLNPIDQHQFNHWCHIRALYESQFDKYRATGQLLPITIDTQTTRQEQPNVPSTNQADDQTLIHITLTTTTMTTMPHGIAQTNTSTSYKVTDELVLPPSPPCVSRQSSNHFQAPFSPLFKYPCHPFSCPPPVICQTIPQSVLNRLMETYALSCDCGVARVRDRLINQSINQENNQRSISNNQNNQSIDQSMAPTEDRSRARTLLHAGSNESQTSVVVSSEDEDEVTDVKMG